jgi:hypothetical protein
VLLPEPMAPTPTISCLDGEEGEPQGVLPTGIRETISDNRNSSDAFGVKVLVTPKLSVCR